jgi:hypothetical protein
VGGAARSTESCARSATAPPTSSARFPRIPRRVSGYALDRLPFEQARRSAFLEGYSPHAGVRVHGNDRQGRENLRARREAVAARRL